MLLYICENPEFIMGEPMGEKPKECCMGPAELIMGSFSRLNVSRLNGTWGCCAWGCEMGTSSE